MYICTYVYYMILLYLEGSGSKFHSVNTKTSQLSSFFGCQELRENMCIYNMYICTYVYYMILLYLEGSGSKFHSVSTKTSQFSPFLDSRSWEKNVYIYNMYICTYVYMYICIYVHMYITWFCYIWRVVVLSFIPSTRKLVNFLPFLDSRSWGKNMSTPKLANFPFFGFQELRKNMCIYIYIYMCAYMWIISNHFPAFYG